MVNSGDEDSEDDVAQGSFMADSTTPAKVCGVVQALAHQVRVVVIALGMNSVCACATTHCAAASQSFA